MGYAWLFYIASIILAALGFYTTFSYDSSSTGVGHIVGGDAYNFIIIAIRGAVYMIAGVISAIFGATIHIYHAIILSIKSNNISNQQTIGAE